MSGWLVDHAMSKRKEGRGNPKIRSDLPPSPSPQLRPGSDEATSARPTSTLRRTASATPSFNTTAADFSKQFNFQHLLNSPLPSPALPSIVPRHGKKPAPRPIRKAVRILARLAIYTFALTILYSFVAIIQYMLASPTSLNVTSLRMNEYNIAGQEPALQQPSPVVVTNTRHKSQWTVAIPRGAEFPLKPSQYARICAQSEDIVQQLHASTSHSHFHISPSESRRTATGFVDVQEAHDQGLLSNTVADQGNAEELVGVQSNNEPETPDGRRDSNICEKSLTFVMETADAGLGKTLLGLWVAFGLAQEEGRAFFIDDSNWAYGHYATFFEPPPMSSLCRPPPAIQRLPCPHQSRHLVVAATTYQWVFEDLIESRSPNRHPHNQATRKRRAFALARAGHDALFHLTGADADYLSHRLDDLDITRSQGSLSIGLHVRRGDRHPWERQYSDSYIPYSTYSNVAQSLITNNTAALSASAKPQAHDAAPNILLASDDPETHLAPEFVSTTERAQAQILLASKAALDAALPDSGPQAPKPDQDPAFIKFVEPNVGWEGGFFASIFWGLGNAAEGRAAARGLREERPKKEPNEESLQLREYVGRAYLLDLKVLGSTSNVVCGVSSFGCRILGVMKGWDEIERGGWTNVDRGYSGWVGFVEDD
ncbi:MAG: hypothetical protein Q9169_004305 [Polycauliona sp. 2 TL-2023]